MKITVNQLRRIIKEEVQRVILKEGTLDATLLPKDAKKLGDRGLTEWFNNTLVKQISEKLKEKIIPIVGKEMGAHLHVGPGANIKEDNPNAKIWIFLQDSFLKEIRRYVQGGYKGSNEFIDELVSVAKSEEEYNEALDTMYRNLLRAVKEVFEDLGFTGSEKMLEASLGIEGSNRRVRAFPRALNQSIQIEIVIQ